MDLRRDSAPRERIFRVLSDPDPRRTRCLLTDLHDDERGLSRALLAHLSSVLPSIEFTREAAPEPDAIWVCGYAADDVERIRALRARHPGALLLVTSGARPGPWVGEARAAGADHALQWPCSIHWLSALLSGAVRAAAEEKN